MKDANKKFDRFLGTGIKVGKGIGIAGILASTSVIGGVGAAALTVSICNNAESKTVTEKPAVTSETAAVAGAMHDQYVTLGAKCPDRAKCVKLSEDIYTFNGKYFNTSRNNVVLESAIRHAATIEKD